MTDTYAPIADINDWPLDALKWHLTFFQHHLNYSTPAEKPIYEMRVKEMQDAINTYYSR